MTAHKTREQTARKRQYKPPQALDTPAPPPGQEYRWVRVHIHNEDDMKNVALARQEGWEFVRADDPHLRDSGLTLPNHEGRFEGIIGVGDLALAVNSTEMVEAKKEYEADLTRRQLQAVDNDLLKEQHPTMPVIRERSTEVSGGRRRPKVDD